MNSKANIDGHPIHPILISFPIALLISTLLFDILWLNTENNIFFQTAYYMQITGIGFGLLAAVPGIIDYIYTVPPKSSAKKRASKHGLLNTTMIIIFLGAWFYKRGDDPSPYIFIGLEVVGSVLLSIAGWMGGTLVYKNEIGVISRYASSGKWKEEYFKDVTGFVAVAEIDDLKLNQMKLVHINEKRIVIARSEKGYVAFDDRCTHKGGSLAGGSMICGTVECPWHGSQFDVYTGAVKADPAKDGIKVYAVEEREGKVFLNTSDL